MRRPRWTADEIKWLRDRYSVVLPEDLLSEYESCFGKGRRSLRSIQGKAAALGLRYLLHWTDEHDAWLRDNYPVHRLNRAELVRAFAARFGIRRTWLALRQRANIRGYLGGPPYNLKPLYAETVRVVGTKGRPDYQQILMIKVPGPDGSPRFVKKKHWVWEQHRGPIPSGHLILQRDGDFRNCDIDNLECVSRSVSRRMQKINASREDGPALYGLAIDWAKLRQAIADAEDKRTPA